MRSPLSFPLLALVIVSSVFFYLGVSKPLMVFERLFFFESEASLLDIIEQLWLDENWPLAVVIGFFSVVFPALKLLYLSASAVLPTGMMRLGFLSFLGHLSKWSMLDVLVVAVVIVATKTSGLAKATALPGLWYFTLCVVLMAVATIWAARRRG